MKAGGICSSLLQQRLISSPFRGSFSPSPFQVLLIFMFNLTICTSNTLLVNIVLWTWSKLLTSVWFLAGIHSGFWSTFVQVKRSLFLLLLFKRMLLIIIFAFWYSVIIGKIRLFFYLLPLPNPTAHVFLEKNNPKQLHKFFLSLQSYFKLESLLSLALGLDCVPCFGKYADVNTTCVQLCLNSGFAFLLPRLTERLWSCSLRLFILPWWPWVQMCSNSGHICIVNQENQVQVWLNFFSLWCLNAD